jgi:acetyl esterase/lipase
LGISAITADKAAVQDGKAAVRFLRANAAKYNLDPNKFAAWGNSAGGYMAAMLGVTGDQATPYDDPGLGNAGISSAVQAVVVWFGAINRLARGESIIARYLPTAKTLPPFLIANGDADTEVSAADAQILQANLKRFGATSTLTIVHGAGHEEPAFMATQMAPTFMFLDGAFNR